MSQLRTNQTHLPSRRVGFTIIELMVTIGTIAILMALLLPNLQKARAASRMVICTSNLSQVGKSLQAYAIDFDGTFLPALDSYTSSTWSGILVMNGYAQVPSQINNASSPPLTAIAMRSSLFMCPETINVQNTDFWSGSPAPTISQASTLPLQAKDVLNQSFHASYYMSDLNGVSTQYRFADSYQVNAVAHWIGQYPFSVYGAAAAIHAFGTMNRINQVLIYPPARVLAVYEGTFWLHDGATNRVSARHNDHSVINSLMLDWHVEPVVSSRFPASLGATGNTRDAQYLMY